MRRRSPDVLPRAEFGERALADVRRRGWAQSVAQREAGVASVSAPVRSPMSGDVIAAVSISGRSNGWAVRPGTLRADPRRRGPALTPLLTA